MKGKCLSAVAVSIYFPNSESGGRGAGPQTPLWAVFLGREQLRWTHPGPGPRTASSVTGSVLCWTHFTSLQPAFVPSLQRTAGGRVPRSSLLLPRSARGSEPSELRLHCPHCESSSGTCGRGAAARPPARPPRRLPAQLCSAPAAFPHPRPCVLLSLWNVSGPGPAPRAPGPPGTELAEPAQPCTLTVRGTAAAPARGPTGPPREQAPSPGARGPCEPTCGSGSCPCARTRT